MTHDPPLNLRGISTLLGVSFWRVRGWRMRAGNGASHTYTLPPPDVSQLHRQPLWSTALIKTWAADNGLWPVGAITRTCPYDPCGVPCAPLKGDFGVRPHRFKGGWCPGGGSEVAQAIAKAVQAAGV